MAKASRDRTTQSLLFAPGLLEWQPASVTNRSWTAGEESSLLIVKTRHRGHALRFLAHLIQLLFAL